MDLTRRNGKPRARLLDLVPGRSGKVYADWLRTAARRSPAGSAPPRWTRSAATATRSATSSKTPTAVLDAFHVVKLGLQAMEETRRRVQQEQLGHRGRKHDPLYRIRNALRAGADRLTARQIERIETGLQAGDPDYEVTVAWRCYQQLRSAFHAPNLADGRADRGPGTRVVPDLPDPRDRPTRPHPASLERAVPGLLHHRPGQQRRHRSDQRHHRTPPPHRPRLPQPRQLPTTNDLGRRKAHPPKSPMSPITAVTVKRAAQARACGACPRFAAGRAATYLFDRFRRSEVRGKAAGRASESRATRHR